MFKDAERDVILMRAVAIARNLRLYVAAWDWKMAAHAKAEIGKLRRELNEKGLPGSEAEAVFHRMQVRASIYADNPHDLTAIDAYEEACLAAEVYLDSVPADLPRLCPVPYVRHGDDH
jgi:hypothetical protein